MRLRAVEIWFILLTMAVLNGGVREALITPRFGSGVAHVMSTVLLSAVIVFVAWMSIRWIGAASAADAFVVGLTWLMLTVAFEFLAGHYLFRDPWQTLLADYNLARGRIWVVVLLSTLLAPVWALRQRRPA
jgi:hypothetical protein